MSEFNEQNNNGMGYPEQQPQNFEPYNPAQNNQQNGYVQPQQYQQYQQPQQYQQSQQYQQYTEYDDANDDSRRFAIASLVLGIVSFFCCGFITSILGLIFGIISKSRKSENNGLAIAGIVVSAIGIVVTIISLIVVVVYGDFYQELIYNLSNY